MEIDQIITGDSLQVMNQIQPGTVDLIITSPPYPGQKADTRSVWEWLDWFMDVASGMHRVLSPVGIAVINLMFKRDSAGWFDHRLFTEFPNTMAGFCLLDVYPFIKANPVPNGASSGIGETYADIPAWEPVFVFSKAPAARDIYFEPVRRPYKPKSRRANGNLQTSRSTKAELNPEGAIQPNYLIISSSGDLQSNPYRAEGQSFPPKLPERFILQYTKPGDLVLDPFCGVGTTCRVAQENGRHWLGIEILEREAAKAREWLSRPYQRHMAEFERL